MEVHGSNPASEENNWILDDIPIGEYDDFVSVMKMRIKNVFSNSGSGASFIINDNVFGFDKTACKVFSRNNIPDQFSGIPHTGPENYSAADGQTLKDYCSTNNCCGAN